MSTMTPMMNAQASPSCQAMDRILGLQIDGKHDDEDDDEHVRHAGAVRHRRHVAAVLGLGQPVGEIGVVEIADRQSDAERRQNSAEDNVAWQFDHAETKAGQNDDVEHDIGEESEKAVPVAGHPPANGD